MAALRDDATLDFSVQNDVEIQFIDEEDFPLANLNEHRATKLKLSANSLPIRHLPIRPAETVCQFDLKFSSEN